jgi:hypothetical protein
MQDPWRFSLVAAGQTIGKICQRAEVTGCEDQSMFALFSKKADVAFRALTTDFSRVGRPLFRHPDWFAAIDASMLFRRHPWRRHIGDPIADNAQSAVDYVVQRAAPGEFDAGRWCIL